MLKYLKKYWLFAILAPLFMVGEVLADLVQPRLMSTIVDEGVLGLSNNGVGNLNLVLTEGLKMIIFVILGGLSGILCGVCANIASQNFGNDLRKDIFKNIMSSIQRILLLLWMHQESVYMGLTKDIFLWAAIVIQMYIRI